MQFDIAADAARPLKQPAPAMTWLKKIGYNLSNFFLRRKLAAMAAPASGRCQSGSGRASTNPPLSSRSAQALRTTPLRSVNEQQMDELVQALNLGADVTARLTSACLTVLADGDNRAPLSAELGDALAHHLATLTASQSDLVLHNLVLQVHTAHDLWPDSPQIIVLLDAVARATLAHRNAAAISEELDEALHLALDDEIKDAEARMNDVLHHAIAQLSGDPEVASDAAEAAAPHAIWARMKDRPQCEYEMLLLLCPPTMAGTLLAAASQSDKTWSQERTDALYPENPAARARLLQQKLDQLLYIEQTKTASGLAIAGHVTAAVRAAAKNDRADVEDALRAAWNEAMEDAAAHSSSKKKQQHAAARTLLGHIQNHREPAREVLRLLAPTAIREQMGLAILATDPPDWQVWNRAVFAQNRLAAIPAYISWCEERRAELLDVLTTSLNTLTAGLKASPPRIDSAALNALPVLEEEFALIATSTHPDDAGLVLQQFDLARDDLFNAMEHASLLDLAKRLPQTVMTAKAGPPPMPARATDLVDYLALQVSARARWQTVSVLRKLAHEHMAGQRQPTGISAALDAVHEKIQSWQHQPENHYHIVVKQLSELPSSEYQAYLEDCDAATLSELKKFCAEGNLLKRAINIQRYKLFKSPPQKNKSGKPG